MADNSNKKDNQVPSLPDCDVTFRVMPMPPDTNQYGDVFGGWIMSQVDLAGASRCSPQSTLQMHHRCSNQLRFQRAGMGR